MEHVAANTDRELWRKGDGDGNGMSHYEPSIHVTQNGDIGINVGGTVYTLPVEKWHSVMGDHLAPGGWLGYKNDGPKETEMTDLEAFDAEVEAYHRGVLGHTLDVLKRWRP